LTSAGSTEACVAGGHGELDLGATPATFAEGALAALERTAGVRHDLVLPRAEPWIMPVFCFAWAGGKVG
jgi:hypothetical protein